MIPFEALPDYEFLKNLFLHVVIACEEQEDVIVEEFDWIVKRQNLIERSALGVGVDLSLMGNAREREFKSIDCDALNERGSPNRSGKLPSIKNESGLIKR